MPPTRSLDRSIHLLGDCIPPEPLQSGSEYKLCTSGFFLNLQHAQALSRQTAANADMDQALDIGNRLDQFEQLKATVIERHDAMRTQFRHVKDCFVCSVAFGLTPAVKIRPNRAPLALLRAKFARALGFTMEIEHSETALSGPPGEV